MDKLSQIKHKIISIEDLESKIAYWRFKDFKIVFTNGCFDLLHQGHIDYLARAADLGNLLVVGLNTDLSIRKIKGESRPIQDQESRSRMLASLIMVDAVILFDEETPYNLIQKIQPDILVKGGDYKEHEIIGSDILKAKGGEIRILELLEGYSTTKIENKIKGIV